MARSLTSTFSTWWRRSQSCCSRKICMQCRCRMEFAYSSRWSCHLSRQDMVVFKWWFHKSLQDGSKHDFNQRLQEGQGCHNLWRHLVTGCPTADQGLAPTFRCGTPTWDTNDSHIRFSLVINFVKLKIRKVQCERSLELWELDGIRIRTCYLMLPVDLTVVFWTLCIFTIWMLEESIW